MLLFFWLFTFAVNLWQRKFVTAVTADVTAVFVNNFLRGKQHTSMCKHQLGAIDVNKTTTKTTESKTSTRNSKTNVIAADNVIIIGNMIIIVSFHSTIF